MIRPGFRPRSPRELLFESRNPERREAARKVGSTAIVGTGGSLLGPAMAGPVSRYAKLSSRNRELMRLFKGPDQRQIGFAHIAVRRYDAELGMNLWVRCGVTYQLMYPIRTEVR